MPNALSVRRTQDTKNHEFPRGGEPCCLELTDPISMTLSCSKARPLGHHLVKREACPAPLCAQQDAKGGGRGAEAEASKPQMLPGDPQTRACVKPPGPAETDELDAKISNARQKDELGVAREVPGTTPHPLGRCRHTADPEL